VNAWYVFEPTRPRPASAPLAVVTHGYFEYAGHRVNDAIARHTARAGNVVVYTRWQTGVATPCPGPVDIEPCIRSEVAGIKGALAFLRARPGHVQPQLQRTSYFGFSFGGIITANIANRWKRLGIPRPRAIWLDDPHDGALTGFDEPALDDSLAGIPATSKVICHAGAQGVIGEPDTADGGCNALFPKLTSVPARNKSLLLTSTDAHGTPQLTALHGVCAGSGAHAVDAYDWGFCWRSWDALRSCAYTGHECRYAVGDTPQNRHVGTWSDGTPILGVKVQTTAPIRPEPIPARAPRPPGRPPTDRPPKATVTSTVRRAGVVIAIRGTATDDRGVDAVELAVVRLRRGGRCRQPTPGGRLVTLRSCGAPTAFLAARGTRRWTIALPRRPRPGTYALVVRVTDSAGQQQHRATKVVL
jgi:hypothetical protein